jgi:methylthioribose-1-phosphate isomerase
VRFYTARWRGNDLEILDQTRLPSEEYYLRLRSCREVVEAIKSLRVRGAPLIGIVAAYGIVLAAREAHSKIEFAVAVNELKESRPTAINLSWAVERMLITFHAYADSPDRDHKLVELALRIHAEDNAMCDAIGRRGAELLSNGSHILTHCNAGALATGGCGTALAIVYHAHWNGKRPVIFADETRPILQGARLTAWELAQEGVNVRVITDNHAGFLMSQGRIDCVIVGADRIASNFDVANKIGTYSLAVLAKAHEIPFYVAAPSTTFDNQLASGSNIPLERRAGSEVQHCGDRRVVPEGVEVINTAFDITPNELISAIITEEEIIKCERWQESD